LSNVEKGFLIYFDDAEEKNVLVITAYYPSPDEREEGFKIRRKHNKLCLRNYAFFPRLTDLTLISVYETFENGKFSQVHMIIFKD
jgi:hypothetical protein